jgi:hypothetical protein
MGTEHPTTIDELLGPKKNTGEHQIILDNEKTLKELIEIAEDEPLKNRVRQEFAQEVTIHPPLSFKNMAELRAWQKVQTMRSRAQAAAEERQKRRKPVVGDWLQATREAAGT